MSNLAKEWKKYREAFRGIAEVLCGRTSGKGASSRNRILVWCMEEVAKAVGEKEVWKRIEKIKYREGQSGVGLRHIYGQKKNAARRVVDKARNDVENEVYNKLEEDGGRKRIYKFARDRDEDGEDMKGGSDEGWWWETNDREEGSIEGVLRIFKTTVERGRKQWRVGATVLCRRESGVGGDHRGGSVDGIEKAEEGKSARH